MRRKMRKGSGSVRRLGDRAHFRLFTCSGKWPLENGGRTPRIAQSGCAILA